MLRVQFTSHVLLIVLLTTAACVTGPVEEGELSDLVSRLGIGTEEATEAQSKLKRLGVGAFPLLVRNVDYQRAACPCFQKATIYPTTIGEVCLDIISIQV